MNTLIDQSVKSESDFKSNGSEKRQPSLRDLRHSSQQPGIEMPGYSRVSLRDKGGKNTIAVAHAAPVIYSDLPVRQLPKDHGTKVEALKTKLVKQFNVDYANLDRRLLKQAVNEAHALAALTFVPMLVLPSLAEEKVQTLAAWTARQRFLRAAKSEAQPVWRSAVEDILKTALRRAFKCNSYA